MFIRLHSAWVACFHDEYIRIANRTLQVTMLAQH